MAKATEKAKEKADRRRGGTPIKTEKKLPTLQEEKEVPQLAEVPEVTPDIVPENLRFENVQLLEDYTLQSLKDYAKATADIAATAFVSALSSQDVIRAQQLDYVGRHCECLVRLLISVKEKEHSWGICISKPQKNNPENETTETGPVAAE